MGVEGDFVAFVAARQHALVRFAYLLTSDWHTAEDLVQTALAKAFASWRALRDPAAVEGYVRRIIVNENATLWRSAWRRNEHPTDRLPEDSATLPAVPRWAGPRDDALWEVVERLPARQRAAVVLRYYEGLSEVETAAVLSCSVGTVKSQTSRAIAAMRARAAADPELLGR